MIAYLRGVVLLKDEDSAIIETQGVGYEVACSSHALEAMGQTGARCELYIHTHYKTDGVALFGFLVPQEKDLFLSLLKVDSVGPKSALKILSSAPWSDIARFIEEGDLEGLAELPKISRKLAEHLVVKLKGKLGHLNTAVAGVPSRTQEVRQLRLEATTALSHLGFKLQDVERTLRDLGDEAWQGDLQTVIKSALNSLTGNL